MILGEPSDKMDRTKSQDNDSMAALADIENVKFYNNSINSPSKFILVDLSDGKSIKSIIRSDARIGHDAIYALLLQETEKKLASKVNGGGRIYLNSDDREIWLWGVSATYGRADFDKAKKVLQSEYKDFEISLIPQMEGGLLKDMLMNAMISDNTERIVSSIDVLGSDTRIVNGKTALHIAVEFGDEEKARALSSICDLQAKDDSGRTPLELAKARLKRNNVKYNTIISILSEAENRNNR
jgi:Janus/Ocnus family (Ocnus)/Ankyrin repeats (3 copies)